MIHLNTEDHSLVLGTGTSVCPQSLAHASAHTTYQTLKIFVKHLPVAGFPTSFSELHPPSLTGNEKPHTGDVHNRCV